MFTQELDQFKSEFSDSFSYSFYQLFNWFFNNFSQNNTFNSFDECSWFQSKAESSPLPWESFSVNISISYFWSISSNISSAFSISNFQIFLGYFSDQISSSFKYFLNSNLFVYNFFIGFNLSNLNLSSSDDDSDLFFNYQFVFSEDLFNFSQNNNSNSSRYFMFFA